MKAQGAWTIEGLFSGRPDSYGLFKEVRSYIESLGNVKIEAAKTQVSFGTQTKFAWVWLPQMWTKSRLENSITLTFDLSRRIIDPRIAEAVEPRPGRWTHHIVLEDRSGFDWDVKAWIKEAYQSSLSRNSRRKHT